MNAAAMLASLRRVLLGVLASLRRVLLGVLASLRRVLLVVLTPLLEKNPSKTITGVALGVPLILSMSRLIVVGFAGALVRQVWLAGIAGWPDATLAMAVVLALPLLGAIERAPPADVLDLAKALLSRVGVGAERATASVYSAEPSKYDDHRDDHAQ